MGELTRDEKLGVFFGMGMSEIKEKAGYVPAMFRALPAFSLYASICLFLAFLLSSMGECPHNRPEGVKSAFTVRLRVFFQVFHAPAAAPPPRFV